MAQIHDKQPADERQQQQPKAAQAVAGDPGRRSRQLDERSAIYRTLETARMFLFASLHGNIRLVFCIVLVYNGFYNTDRIYTNI